MKGKQDLKLNILIPDGDSFFTLWMINCLSKHKNIKIHILSKEKWVESRFSRHLSSFTHYDGQEREKIQVKFFLEMIVEKGIDVILPSNVPAIRMISKHKEKFERLGLKISLPSVESLDIANSKWNLAEFLNKNDLPIPKTFFLNSQNINELDEFPILFKPLSGWNGSGFQLIKNKEGLKSLRTSKIKNYIGQEYVDGIDMCVNVICENGSVLAQTIQKGILPSNDEFKPNLGADFIRDEKLSNIIESVLEKLSWSGVVNFDVIFDPIKNRYYIIEMNPRFWGSIEASESVGVNFPYLMCLLSKNIEFEAPAYNLEKFASNKGLLKLFKDFLLLRNNKVGRIKNSSIFYAISDPLPKAFKYYNKIMTRIIQLNKDLTIKKVIIKDSA